MPASRLARETASTDGGNPGGEPRQHLFRCQLQSRNNPFTPIGEQFGIPNLIPSFWMVSVPGPRRGTPQRNCTASTKIKTKIKSSGSSSPKSSPNRLRLHATSNPGPQPYSKSRPGPYPYGPHTPFGKDSKKGGPHLDLTPGPPGAITGPPYPLRTFMRKGGKRSTSDRPIFFQASRRKNLSSIDLSYSPPRAPGASCKVRYSMISASPRVAHSNSKVPSFTRQAFKALASLPILIK